MNQAVFSPSTIEKNFFVDSIAANKRGKAFSIKDTYGSKISKTFVNDAKIHDANFAFLTTALAKLHTKLYEPLYLRPLSEIRLEGYVASNLTLTDNKVAYIKITEFINIKHNSYVRRTTLLDYTREFGYSPLFCMAVL